MVMNTFENMRRCADMKPVCTESEVTRLRRDGTDKCRCFNKHAVLTSVCRMLFTLCCLPFWLHSSPGACCHVRVTVGEPHRHFPFVKNKHISFFQLLKSFKIKLTSDRNRNRHELSQHQTVVIIGFRFRSAEEHHRTNHSHNNKNEQQRATNCT